MHAKFALTSFFDKIMQRATWGCRFLSWTHSPIFDAFMAHTGQKKIEWEMAPATIVGRLFPKPTRKWALAPQPSSNQVEVSGFVTRDVSVAGAAQNSREISDHFRKRYEAGNHRAVFKILDVNLRFVQEDWVRNALCELRVKGLLRTARRHYGRKWGGTNIPRPLVVGLLRALAEERGSIAKALIYIQSRSEIARDVGLSTDRLRTLFFSTLRDGRFRPLLFQPEPWRPATPELERLLERPTPSLPLRFKVGEAISKKLGSPEEMELAIKPTPDDTRARPRKSI